MKNSVYFVLSMLLAFALNTCSNNVLENSDFSDREFLKEWDLTSYLNVCTPVTDALQYPEPWNVDVERTFVIPDETIRSMSTCGLLVTLLEDPSIHAKKPWCTYCSSWYNSGVTIFNNELQTNKVAVELFERNDCFPVLASEYLTNLTLVLEEIAPGIYKCPEKGICNMAYFEMLLASDMNISALSEKEEIQLMAMALERTKHAKDIITTCHILIAIMKSYQYAPFVKDIEPRLTETTNGYTMSTPYDSIQYIGLGAPHINLILEYAKQFLNEQKNKHYEIN